MAMIQVRVDDDLKVQATKVFEELGLDLSTAIRMFLKRSVMCKGIPFGMIINEERKPATKALEAMRRSQERAKENGTCNLTLDEINEEIRLARLESEKKWNIMQ